jgi:inhibitor of KinA
MESPGGWTLIGRTPLKLFDPVAQQPFALEPGMRVRFRAIAAGDYDA